MISNETVTGIIGFVLFSISEILPLINIRTNGLLHSLVLGLKTAFKPEIKEIQLIESIMKTNPNIAKLFNSVTGNKQIMDILTKLVDNPFKANNVTTIQNDDDIDNIVASLQKNPQLKDTFIKIISDSEIYTSVNVLVNSPNSLKNTLVLHHNKKLNDTVNILHSNYKLIDIINEINNDKKLMNQVSNTINQSFA